MFGLSRRRHDRGLSTPAGVTGAKGTGLPATAGPTGAPVRRRTSRRETADRSSASPASISTPGRDGLDEPDRHRRARRPAARSRHQQMLYRVTPSATTADLAAAATRRSPATSRRRGRRQRRPTSHTGRPTKTGRRSDHGSRSCSRSVASTLLAAAFIIVNLGERDRARPLPRHRRHEGRRLTRSQVLSHAASPQVDGAAVDVGDLDLGVVLGAIASQPVVWQQTAGLRSDSQWCGLCRRPLVGGVFLVARGIGVAGARSVSGLPWRASHLSDGDSPDQSRGSAPTSRSGGGRLQRRALLLGSPAADPAPIRLGLASGSRAAVACRDDAGCPGRRRRGACDFSFGWIWPRSGRSRPITATATWPRPIRVDASSQLKPTQAAPPRAAPPQADAGAITAAITSDPQTPAYSSRHRPGRCDHHVPVPGADAVRRPTRATSTWIGYALVERSSYSRHRRGRRADRRSSPRPACTSATRSRPTSMQACPWQLRLVGKIFDVEQRGA